MAVSVWCAGGYRFFVKPYYFGSNEILGTEILRGHKYVWSN